MKTRKQLLSALLGLLFVFSSHACNLKGDVPKEKASYSKAALWPSKKEKKHYVKIALLLDTSNSMDGLINQAKAQLWDIVNEFTYAKCGNDTRPALQIALYEYGNDNLSHREGYLRQVIGFSGDLDAISEKLFSLATNGGEEYCGTVINTSLKQLDWGNDADDLKLIFIAGNEPFTQGKLDYRDATAQAKEKDVVVNTIFCGNFDQGIHSQWQDAALRTGGDYMSIDHNREVAYVATPYDDQIIFLNKQLNKTYVAYGNLGSSKIAAQEVQDANAYELDETVAVKRAVSKSSRVYQNKSWDLVDALAEDEELLEDMEDAQLPPELQGKTAAEQKEYIAKKEAERKKIQQEIQKLNAQRNTFLSQQQDAQKGELENAMIQAIKKQAEKKDYRWD